MTNQPLRTIEEHLIEIDDRARSLFEPYTDTVAMRALDLFSKLGDQPELRLIAGGLLVIGTIASNDRLVRAGARMLVAHEAATIVKDVVKNNIDRTRPRSAGSAKRPKKGGHTAKEKTSFPSGHSAGAIAAARAFSREFPEHGTAAIGGAALIAASQVPRCAHYPTDVAAGLLVGLVIEEVTNAAWNAAEMDERSVA
jgi:membrane-associated phospholipid phosphatase